MIPPKVPDVEAEVSLLSAAEGGRTAPARSGYRPHHRILPDLQTTGTHEYVDDDVAALGSVVRARITFIAPEEYPCSLSVGQRLEIFEGARLVGHARITRIMNKLLERSTQQPNARKEGP